MKKTAILFFILCSIMACEKEQWGTPSNRSLESFSDDFTGNGYSDNYDDSSRYSYFTDTRDGNVYRYIKIGKYYWMADNLRYQSNGYSPYTSPALIKKYGYIYPQGYGSCPDGWHPASEVELLDLISTIKSPDELLAVDAFPPSTEPRLTGNNKWGFSGRSFGYSYVERTVSTGADTFRLIPSYIISAGKLHIVINRDPENDQNEFRYFNQPGGDFYHKHTYSNYQYPCKCVKN